MSRRDKLYARLRSEEAKLRVLFVANLRIVARGRSTMFFTTIDGAPVAAGAPVLVLARRILELATQICEPHSDLLASLVVQTFEDANDRSDEHRLGPIRLAQELLKQLGET